MREDKRIPTYHFNMQTEEEEDMKFFNTYPTEDRYVLSKDIYNEILNGPQDPIIGLIYKDDVEQPMLRRMLKNVDEMYAFIEEERLVGYDCRVVFRESEIDYVGECFKRYGSQFPGKALKFALIPRKPPKLT